MECRTNRPNCAPRNTQRTTHMRPLNMQQTAPNPQKGHNTQYSDDYGQIPHNPPQVICNNRTKNTPKRRRRRNQSKTGRPHTHRNKTTQEIIFRRPFAHQCDHTHKSQPCDTQKYKQRRYCPNGIAHKTNNMAHYGLVTKCSSHPKPRQIRIIKQCCPHRPCTQHKHQRPNNPRQQTFQHTRNTIGQKII